MITGIDETGDFDPTSKLFHFFVAVHLDQNGNKLEIKRSQFNIWESSVPDKFKTDNKEIKGKDLPEEYLTTFFKEVLNSKPSALYSVVRIVPAENSPEILEKHKAHEIKGFERIIDMATKSGHVKWAEAYKQILIWFRNRNYQTIIKMKCLNSLIGISFNRVLGWAQITYALDKNDISNLRNIAFKIDKDFVKADNVKILWNEMFRQFWQQFSKSEPMPLVALWKDEEHPFLKEYKSAGGKTDMKRVLRRNTKFMDSKESWEIRMADITATILHRYHNKGQCKDIWEEMKKHLGEKQKNYEHLTLNDIAPS